MTNTKVRGKVCAKKPPTGNKTCLKCNTPTTRPKYCSDACARLAARERDAAKRDAEYFNGAGSTAIGLSTRTCWVCRKAALKRYHRHHVVSRKNYPDGKPLLVVLCGGCHSLVSDLGKRIFLEDTKAVADLITLARFEKGLPNVRTVVLYEEVT